MSNGEQYAGEINGEKKKQLMVAIYSLAEEQKALAAPFAFHPAPSKLAEASRLSLRPADRTALSIFAGEVGLEHKLSLGLSMVAWLGFAGLLLDLLCMIGRFNFYSLLTDTLLLAVFLLNYFDRVYIRLLLLALLLAVVAEAAWLAMKIDVPPPPLSNTGTLRRVTGTQGEAVSCGLWWWGRSRGAP